MIHNLQTHLQNCTIFNGEKSIIPNDLIKTYSDHLVKNIKVDISEERFLAITNDKTTDIAKTCTIF